MRIVFAVFVLLITYVVSYPSYRDAATDNDENDLELELRSILNQLDDEQMTRGLTADDDNEESNDDDDYAVSKRQGGLNVIDKQSECEIKCIHAQRNPKTGKGKTVKEAAKTCRTLCPAVNKKRGGKKTVVQRKQDRNTKLNLREFVDDASSGSSEEQQTQRRELYDYLMEQLQQNTDE